MALEELAAIDAVSKALKAGMGASDPDLAEFIVHIYRESKATTVGEFKAALEEVGSDFETDFVELLFSALRPNKATSATTASTAARIASARFRWIVGNVAR